MAQNKNYKNIGKRDIILVISQLIKRIDAIELTLNMFVKFANLAMMPLVFLNIFSGIIAFIWLAVVGEWSIIGIGSAIGKDVEPYSLYLGNPGIFIRKIKVENSRPRL